MQGCQSMTPVQPRPEILVQLHTQVIKASPSAANEPGSQCGGLVLEDSWKTLTRAAPNAAAEASANRIPHPHRSTQCRLGRQLPQTYSFGRAPTTYKWWIISPGTYIQTAHLSTFIPVEVSIQLKIDFAKHGVPSQVVSDNGVEFTRLAQSHGLLRRTCSPGDPQSNGERTIQTIKGLLKEGR